MGAETLLPTSVEDASNYTSLLASDLTDDPGSPDGLWGSWDGNGDTNFRGGFASPSGNPTVGADLQTFRCLIRKDSSGGNDTTWSLELWEAGVQVSVLNTGTTTATGGEVVSGTWNASSLSDPTGADVEIVLAQTAGGGGSPSSRRAIEVGAAAWDVDYSEGVPNEVQNIVG